MIDNSVQNIIMNKEDLSNPLNNFISLVFKDDRIKTITDARKHIEEEFDSNYKV